MFKRNPEKANQEWKSKYFSSLEELEKKEKEWSAFDTIMRNAMSRLSVMLDGMDRSLDKELDYLRRALRRGADAGKIRQLIKSTLDTLEQVEQKQKLQKKLSAPEAYQRLLDELAFPKGTAREVKALNKSIGKLSDDDSPSAVIEEFVRLVKHSYSLIRTSTEEKLNSEKKEAPHKEKPPAADRQASNPVELSQADDSTLSGRTVLESLMSEVLFPEFCQTEVKIVRERLQNVKLENELDRLAHELAGILNEALPSSQQHERVAELIEGANLTINEILLQLLERIELPVDMGDEVAGIQSQLEGNVSESEWPTLLGRISRLIGSMREKAHDEKKSLEAFLTQLTDQLQTLDEFVRGVEQDHHDAVKIGTDFRVSMDDQLHHMGRSVDEASELEQLKQVIKTRLDTLTQHMEKLREHEEQRDNKAQQKITELNTKIQAMEQDSEALRKNVRKERELAMVDPLTEIRNRLAYDERIEQEYVRWKRYQPPLSLMVIDIDFFKKINDNYGHMAGDKVLHTVAQHLNSNIRETDFLARYGGEEFVIIMPDTAVGEAMTVAEKLRDEVENCGFHYRGESVNVTISSGVAEFIAEDTVESAFEKADSAMYRAKEGGRNRCESG